jgi:hypothetical protein
VPEAPAKKALESFEKLKEKSQKMDSVDEAFGDALGGDMSENDMGVNEKEFEKKNTATKPNEQVSDKKEKAETKAIGEKAKEAATLVKEIQKGEINKNMIEDEYNKRKEDATAKVLEFKENLGKKPEAKK